MPTHEEVEEALTPFAPLGETIKRLQRMFPGKSIPEIQVILMDYDHMVFITIYDD